MIAKWVRELILETIDPWIAQEPEMSKQDLLDSIIQENDEGFNMFVGSKKYNTVLMLRYSTPWVADVHLFTRHNNPWDVVRTGKKIQKFVFDNIGYERLEMRTHLKNVCKIAEKCGWSKEGEHPNAVKLEDGTFATEYSYGLINE